MDSLRRDDLGSPPRPCSAMGPHRRILHHEIQERRCRRHEVDEEPRSQILAHDCGMMKDELSLARLIIDSCSVATREHVEEEHAVCDEVDDRQSG